MAKKNGDAISRILIVDDDETLAQMSEKVLTRLGFHCRTAIHGVDALEKLKHHDIDVVITDIYMPEMNGIDLLKNIIQLYNHIDVIVLTGHSGEFTYNDIIENGAKDFISKPVNMKELAIRIKRVVKERQLLTERDNTYKELKNAYLDTINRLVLATEYKDDDTGDHIIRMSRYSHMIAKKMSLPEKDIDTIKYSSTMHDIGKLGIPDHIMLKPGKLTRDEFEIMKTHTTIGANILDKSKSYIISMGKEIAISHHEKWDGSGYPNQLKNEQIPLPGRIVAVADVFDALASERPYKKAFSIEKSLNIMKSERAKHFDPEILDLFIDHIDEVITIRNETTQAIKFSINDHLVHW